MTHPTCLTCGHYEQSSTDKWQGASERGKGRCLLIPLSASTSEWSDNLDDVLKPEYVDLLAFVTDASGYAASLRPAPDFYCPMHTEVWKK